MADVLFIAMMCAFFALAVLLVRVCDRIIGDDPDGIDVVDVAGVVGSDGQFDADVDVERHVVAS
jgi:hypothetical protein